MTFKSGHVIIIEKKKTFSFDGIYYDVSRKGLYCFTELWGASTEVLSPREKENQFAICFKAMVAQFW